jgi:hypothetical protein
VFVMLLLLWVIVVPALTVAGTYVVSGTRGSKLRARHERLTGLVPPVRSAPAIQHSSPIADAPAHDARHPAVARR